MKQKKRLFMLFIHTAMALLFSVSVYAQQVIRGSLKSASGEPLSGASIVVKGTGKSAIADSKGTFTIDAANGAVLVISSVGYKSREITVTGQEINEVLETTDNSLNEVVVIGYQSVKRKDLTGAVGIINAATANRNIANSLAESIQGLTRGYG